MGNEPQKRAHHGTFIVNVNLNSRISLMSTCNLQIMIKTFYIFHFLFTIEKLFVFKYFEQQKYLHLWCALWCMKEFKKRFLSLFLLSSGKNKTWNVDKPRKKLIITYFSFITLLNVYMYGTVKKFRLVFLSQLFLIHNKN